MAWNDPIAPVPDYGARPADGGQALQGQPGMVQPAMPGAMPAAGGVQPFNMPALGTQPAASGFPAPAAGASAPAMTPNPVFPGAPAGMPAVQEKDEPDAGDVIWIERTKRAIAESQNDPHRQVQLLQHLNKLYLKERFGREVQADKG